jgi:hypothetical protein
VAFGFLGAFLGPVLGGLFNHSTGSLDGALAQSEVESTNDMVATVATNAQVSHQFTQVSNQLAVQNEEQREAFMKRDFELSVIGAQQTIVQHQMKQVEDSTA